jgi:4-methyl-5(b-hydroxyethyl)-thiazole monophosphate biosynthesis
MKATCYPGLEDKLLGADVITDERVVTDGNITTSRGVGTAISFALRLIAILKDEATANRVKRGIVYGHQ